MREPGGAQKHRAPATPSASWARCGAQHKVRSIAEALVVKNLPAMQETRVRSLSWKDPLEKEMANPLQYSCLENPMDGGAWRDIQYMGLQRVGHN